MKLLKKRTIIGLLCCLATSGGMVAAVDVPSWQAFTLNTDEVDISIVQGGAKFSPIDKLSGIKTQGPKNQQISDDKQINKEAIAMAIGYCVFLQLTDVPNELEKAGADQILLNDIMSGVGINYTLAMGFQESTFDIASHSGYFQIDNHPWALLSNALSPNYGGDRKPEYYSFMAYLNGGATYGYKTDPDPANFYLGASVLTQGGEKCFIWDSIEKGYYDALSYNMNKVPYKNNVTSVYTPALNFSLPVWVVDYAKKSELSTRAPYYDNPSIQYGHKSLEAPDQYLKIEPFNALGILQGYWYNRGQNPYTLKNESAIMIVEAISNNKIQSVFDDFPEGETAEAYGKRYIWQIPWMTVALNNGKKVYQEMITRDDVIDTLRLLDGFYNGGEAEDPAVQAGVNEAMLLTWNSAFNSKTTFDNIMAVTVAMMEKSKTIDFYSKLKNLIADGAYDANKLDVTKQEIPMVNGSLQINPIDWSNPNFYTGKAETYPEWKPDTEYSQGDIITFEKKAYRSKWGSAKNDSPKTAPWSWEEI